MITKLKTQLLWIFFLSQMFIACSPAFQTHVMGHAKITPQTWSKFLKNNKGNYSNIVCKYMAATEVPYVNQEAFILKNPIFEEEYISGNLSLSLSYMEADFNTQRIMDQRLSSEKEKELFFNSMVIFVKKDLKLGETSISYDDIAYIETYRAVPIDMYKTKRIFTASLAGGLVVGLGTLYVLFIRFVDGLG